MLLKLFEHDAIKAETDALPTSTNEVDWKKWSSLRPKKMVKDVLSPPTAGTLGAGKPTRNPLGAGTDALSRTAALSPLEACTLEASKPTSPGISSSDTAAIMGGLDELRTRQ